MREERKGGKREREGSHLFFKCAIVISSLLQSEYGKLGLPIASTVAHTHTHTHTHE